MRDIASDLDGGVVIGVDMNVDDAEKELARLKKRVLHLEGDIEEKSYKKSALISSLREAKKELASLKENAASPDSMGKIRDTEAQITKIRNEIEKCHQSLVDSNLTLEAVKLRYGEISQEAERLRNAEQSKPPRAETDPQLQKMSEDAKAANDRITELQERMTELQEQRSRLGLAIGARAEYNDLTAQIEAVDQEILSCEEYLDQLAENDGLGKLANGAEIAEQRINDLTQYLEGLEAQNQKLGLAFGAKDQRAELLSEIAEMERLLDAYRRNLDAAGSSDSMRHIADDAEVANQHIIELNQELLEMEQRRKELSEAGHGLGYQEYDDLTAKIAAAKRELSEYEKALTKSGKAPEEQVSRTSQAMEKLNSILSKMAPEFGEKVSEITGQVMPALERIAPEIAGQITPAIESAGTALAGIAPELTAILTIAKLIYGVVKKVVERAIEIANKVGAALQKAGGIIADWLSKGTAAAKKFGSAAASILGEVSKNLSGLMKNLNVFPKLADAIGSKLKRLGQMIRRVFVFSVITSGLRALRSQVSAYLNLNEQFSTALRRLQGVLLTAFQPIYDVIVPALTTLIQVLSQAIAVVVQFFSALFGTTARKAQANAKALYGQSKALKETGEAAEEAAGSLAAFDEINTIETEKGSSGGGGGGGADTGPLFDWNYDDESFGSWGEAFSAFLDKLLDGLPKLEEAFKNFADWLNDLSKKLYDMFTFPGVLDKVKRLGKGLAEAFNKLVDWIDWEMLGRALGAGLNLALNFLTSFLYAFDWMNLGRKLAEFVNGLVDEIDWYEFGRLLWAGFKIALETLAGFILRLNMPLMARAASDTIKGFFDEMDNTIARINWQEIGRQIARFLNNIDWYGCITSALTAIQDAIVALAAMVMGFVDELNWSSIARKIYTAINDSLNQVDWRNIGMIIGNAFKAIFDFVRELVAGIHWHQIGENIADFILGFDFVGALSGLAMLIAEGINAAVQLACGFLDRVEPELKSIAEGIANGLKEAIEAVDWKKFGEVVGRAIKGALSFVAGLLDPSLFYSIGNAIGDFLVNLDWVGIVAGLANVLANAIKSAVAAVRGFLDSVQPHLKEIATGIAEQINQFVRDVDWKEVGRTINDGLKAALDFLITLIEQINWAQIGVAIGDLISAIDWSGIFGKVCRLVADVFFGKLLAAIVGLPNLIEIGNAIVEGLAKGIAQATIGLVKELWNSFIKPIIDAICGFLKINSPSKVFEEIGEYCVEGLLLGIKETWSGIVEFFKEKVDAIVDFFNGAWDGIKEKASLAWGEIKTTLGDIWDSISEKATEIFEAVVKAVQDAWENIKKATSDVWKEVKKALEDAWKTIKDKAKEAFDFVKDTVTKVWDGIKTKTNEIWNGLQTFLTTLWNNLKTTVKTVFDNVLKTIKDTWDNVKRKTEEIWNNLKRTLEETWNNLKNAVIRIFGEIKKTIVDAWENIKREAIEKWNNIKKEISDRIEQIKTDARDKFEEVRGKINEAWENIKRDIPGKLEGIKSAIREKWNDIVSSAKTWGSDLCSNLASGISGGVSKVKNAVTGLADKINRNLHFSEPDEGPLSDFHTYMPDMLELMAKGIRDNTDLAVSAASDLAGSIANTISGKSIGVNMDMPDISKFSIPLIAQGAVIPSNREFTMVVQGENGSSQEQDILTRQTFRSEMTRTTNLLHSILSAIEEGKVIKVDGTQFGRTAIATINSVNRMNGKQGLLI